VSKPLLATPVAIFACWNWGCETTGEHLLLVYFSSYIIYIYAYHLQCTSYVDTD